MTGSSLSTRFCLGLVSLALVLTACADVGSGDAGGDAFPVVTSTDQDVIYCQSIRVAMQKDKKAADAARSAGRPTEAARLDAAVRTGAEGAKSVKGCDVSDLFPSPAGTGGATTSPAAGPSPG
jgi:hypothetical protein